MSVATLVWDHLGKNDLLLNRAQALLGDEVKSFHLVAFLSDAMLDQYPEASMQSLRAELTAAAEAAGIGDAKIEVVGTNDIDEWLVEHTQQSAWLIKMRHPSEHRLASSTDWQLLRHHPASMVLLSPQKWRAKGAILAAVDILNKSEQQRKIDMQVLFAGNDMAGRLGYDFEIGYVIPINPVAEELSVKDAGEVLAQEGRMAGKRVQQTLENYGFETDLVHVRAGKPSREIPSIANKMKADLVVMGSVGRKGLEGFLLGNTAEDVIKHLRTDLAVLKLPKKD